MKRLAIKNFKGICSLKELDLCCPNATGDKNEVNLLLYAENGGGKTSIAEAIRLATFHDILEKEIVKANVVGEEREAAKRDWLNGYLHNTCDGTFEIEIDDRKFSSTQTNISINSNVHILGRSQLVPTSKININDIIAYTYFGEAQLKEELLSSTAIDLVLAEVNDYLKNNFKEKIRVIRPEIKEPIVGITGIQDGHIAKDIHQKLNESHQNLIKILIFISYLYLLPKPTNDKKHFVVFDDIMSSLDLSNRITLAQIIIDLGKDFQLLVMTHNVGFFNLIKHLSGIHNTHDAWKFASLYKQKEDHVLFSQNDTETVEKLLERFGGTILPTDDLAINAMRKHFERLLHEFSKIITIGTQEETSDLINRICNTEKKYYCCIEGNKIYTHFDLLKTISNLVKSCPPEALPERIKKQFEKYNNGNTLPWVIETIRGLTTYQKVILHQGSHDQIGTHPIISTKEIAITLDLMKRLEHITTRSSSNYPYFI